MTHTRIGDLVTLAQSAQPFADVADKLTLPDRLWSRGDVLTRPCPVPATPGVYAWYFDGLSAIVPLRGCQEVRGFTRLYVGISPGRPPRNGKPPSSQTIRHRIRYHYRGNAAGSTLRLTLGSLLSDELGIQLRRVGSGERLTFGAGEQVLSDWMSQHARVAWCEHPTPWDPEHHLIQKWVLPLNLDQNKHSPFQSTLSPARRAARMQARALPVLDR